MMRKSYRFLVVAALGAVLIGCGGAGETTRKVVKNLNPVNWFGDDDAIENEGVKETKDRQAWIRGGSPARKSFPKLGDMQSKPKKPTSQQQSQKIAKGLAADTQNAQYSEQQLRQSASVFGGRGQPRQEIKRSRVVPNVRTNVKAPTPPVSRPVTLPTLALPGAVRPPQPASTTLSSAIQPPAPTRIAPPPGNVASSRFSKKPALKTAAKHVVQPPLVKVPQAPQKSRFTPRPRSTRPTLAPPPPTLSTPRLARSVSSQISQTPTGSMPLVAGKPPAPTVTKSTALSSSGGFATPVGQPPNSKAKAPPVPQPLRGRANAQTVAVAAPGPAQLLGVGQTKSTSPHEAVLKSIKVGTIYFSDGSDRLSDEDVSIIAAITQAFAQTGGKIRVVGHSSIGTNSLSRHRREKINFQMSLRRARAVADELIRYGVPQEHVEVIAEGDHAPIYEESTPTGAAHNRRAEIFIDYRERS